MKSFFDTEKYTLVPYEYHSTGKERECLESLFSIQDEEPVAIDVPSFDAAFLYLKPSSAVDSVPASYLLLEQLENVPEMHKLAVRFSEGMVTVSLADREHLLLLCSYPAGTFTDSLYYIFAALKEVLFEPEHTVIHWCGDIQEEDQCLMERYFEKVIHFEL